MHKLQWIQHKIYSRNTLVQARRIWQITGKKVVFTNGCFDILHRGHLDLLAQAADLGNILIVALNEDSSVKRLKGPERPINNESDRAFQIASLLCTDAICLFDEDTPESLIKLLQPDILVKGGDYTIDKIVGADFVQENGGKVEIIPFVQDYSTSSIIQKIKCL